MKFKYLIASIVFAATSSSAHAALIERTFDLTAADFTLTGGSPTPAPVDPVELIFRVVFDLSVTVSPATTTGLTIEYFNLPNPPYSLAFVYDSSTGYLTVATYPFLDGCDVGAASFCTTLGDPTGPAPIAYGTTQVTSSDGIWQTDHVSVGVLPVPEPSTWALTLVGFGGMGWLLRSRHRTPAVA